MDFLNVSVYCVKDIANKMKGHSPTGIKYYLKHSYNKTWYPKYTKNF